MRAVCALLIAALLLAACDPSAPTPTPPRPADSPASPAASGTLRIAIAEPDELLPQRAETTGEQWLADALFDGLTRWGPAGEPLPGAAESWHSDDLRIWRFTLRADGRWHDGRSVTAADFVRGYALLREEGVLAHLLADVETVEVDGPQTLVVELAGPDALLPVRVGHPALAPLPPEAPATAEADAQPLGNGPFAAAEARGEGRFLRLRRFEQWRNGALPALDEIVVQFMDADTAFLAFQQRRVHVAEVPPGALAEATRRYGARVHRQEQAALYLLGMDVSRPPFADVRVRRALTQAVDRVALARAVLEGNTTPAHGLLPPGLPETVAEQCAVCAHDPEGARAVFAAAGVSTLTLTVSAGGGHEAVARRLAADLAVAGVRLQVEVLASDAWLPALRAGRTRLYRFGWRPDLPAADALLRPLLHSASVPQGPGDVGALRHNHGRYRAPDVDALLDEARRTPAEAVRAAKLRQAARLAVQRDHAVVPLLFLRHRMAVAAELRGFRLGPLGLPDLARVRLTPVQP